MSFPLPSSSFRIGGAVANSIGAILNTPIDVIKTRIQKQGTEIKYKNALHCGILTVKEEGISALFKGSSEKN
jgi:hypothetical protein